ncbi:MAG: divalent-cation tolerance protein CutA, partial [Hyphomonas sp.]
MTDLILVRVTCPSQRVAEEIAEAAVEARLAACANISGQMSSTYRWKGVVEQAFEVLLTLKTTISHWQAIDQLVAKKHPYDVPAIVALPCVQANALYET